MSSDPREKSLDVTTKTSLPNAVREDVQPATPEPLQINSENLRRKAEEDARLKAEEDARLKAEEQARLKAEEDARLKATEQARLEAEEAARLKAEQETRLKAEEQARLRAEQEARLKAEEVARLKEENKGEVSPEASVQADASTPSQLSTGSTDSMSGRQILDEVHDRHDRPFEYEEQNMVLADKSGNLDKRKMRRYKRDMGSGETRFVSIFAAPAGVKGVALVTWKHDDKDDDQWLYLPAQGKKMKRVAKGG